MITLFTYVLFHCYKLPFTALKTNRVHWEQHLLQFFSAKFRALATHKLFQRFFLTFSKLCFFPFGGWLQGFLVTLRVRRINHLYRLILSTNSTENRIFIDILPKLFGWGVERSSGQPKGPITWSQNKHVGQLSLQKKIHVNRISFGDFTALKL